MKVSIHQQLALPLQHFFYLLCMVTHQYKYSVCEPCISSNLIKYKAAPNLIIF